MPDLDHLAVSEAHTLETPLEDPPEASCGGRAVMEHLTPYRSLPGFPRRSTRNGRSDRSDESAWQYVGNGHGIEQLGEAAIEGTHGGAPAACCDGVEGVVHRMVVGDSSRQSLGRQI